MCNIDTDFYTKLYPTYIDLSCDSFVFVNVQKLMHFAKFGFPG